MQTWTNLHRFRHPGTMNRIANARALAATPTVTSGAKAGVSFSLLMKPELDPSCIILHANLRLEDSINILLLARAVCY